MTLDDTVDGALPQQVLRTEHEHDRCRLDCVPGDGRSGAWGGHGAKGATRDRHARRLIRHRTDR